MPYVVEGYRLWDKVLYKGQECFVSGRRASGSFALRKLDGTVVTNSISFKKLQLLEPATNYLIGDDHVGHQALGGLFAAHMRGSRNNKLRIHYLLPPFLISPRYVEISLLKKAMLSLNERERQIIELRFGVNRVENKIGRAHV